MQSQWFWFSCPTLLTVLPLLGPFVVLLVLNHWSSSSLVAYAPLGCCRFHGWFVLRICFIFGFGPLESC